MKKNKLLPDDLYYFIIAHDDGNLPAGAWYQILVDSVTFWNEEHGTNFDENETVHAYFARKELEQT
jgi:hypothetical protein